MTLNDSEDSQRVSLGTFSRMGAASVLQAASGMLRAKLVAVLIGPAGVGFFGLLLSFTQTVALIGILGQDLVGPRQIAQARGSIESLARSTWALAALSFVLAGLSGLTVLIMRAHLQRLLGMQVSANDVGWLSFAVALTVLAALPIAVLQGRRQIGTLARTNAWAALGSLVIGTGSVVLWGRTGIVGMIIAAPACLLLAGLPGLVCAMRGQSLDVASLPRVICDLAIKGTPYMLASAVVVGSPFAARTLIQHLHGTESLGFYTAATTIGLTYLPLLLGALGADFLPRLASVIQSPEATASLVSEETEVALLIVIPIALSVIALAPWVIGLLFSTQFRVAAPILQLQVLADMIRVSVWPLGFVLLARGEGLTHFCIEATAQTLFLAATLYLAENYGIRASGAAFLILSISASALSLHIVRQRISLTPNIGAVMFLGVGLALGLAIMLVSWLSPIGGAAIGTVCTICVGIFSLVRLARLAAVKGRMGVFARVAGTALARIGLRP